MTEAQAADISAMERVRQAALARAQAPAQPTVQLHGGEVKEAVKAFNAAVHQVPDYMHVHSTQILDALQILARVLKDLIEHKGKSPKDPSKQVRSNQLLSPQQTASGCY